jgi:DNA-binding NtrC family response regulator
MIQVVDDEFDIVNVTKFFPRDIRLNVFGFTDLLLALKHFHINCKKYGLVISDIGMPRMNRYEFVKQVKKINPKVKVILMMLKPAEQVLPLIIKSDHFGE